MGQVLNIPIVADNVCDIIALLGAYGCWRVSRSARMIGENEFRTWKNAARACHETQEYYCNKSYIDRHYRTKLILCVIWSVLFGYGLPRLLFVFLRYCGFTSQGLVPRSSIHRLRAWATRSRHRRLQSVIRRLELTGIRGRWSLGVHILLSLTGVTAGYIVGARAAALLQNVTRAL